MEGILLTNAFIDSDRSAIVLASIVVIDLSPMLVITATNHTDTQAMSNNLWIHRDRLFGELIVWC